MNRLSAFIARHGSWILVNGMRAFVGRLFLRNGGEYYDEAAPRTAPFAQWLAYVIRALVRRGWVEEAASASFEWYYFSWRAPSAVYPPMYELVGALVAKGMRDRVVGWARRIHDPDFHANLFRACCRCGDTELMRDVVKASRHRMNRQVLPWVTYVDNETDLGSNGAFPMLSHVFRDYTPNPHTWYMDGGPSAPVATWLFERGHLSYHAAMDAAVRNGDLPLLQRAWSGSLVRFDLPDLAWVAPKLRTRGLPRSRCAAPSQHSLCAVVDYGGLRGARVWRSHTLGPLNLVRHTMYGSSARVTEWALDLLTAADASRNPPIALARMKAPPHLASLRLVHRRVGVTRRDPHWPALYPLWAAPDAVDRYLRVTERRGF